MLYLNQLDYPHIPYRHNMANGGPLEGATRRKLALILATVTAPYTFLVPASWLYG